MYTPEDSIHTNKPSDFQNTKKRFGVNSLDNPKPLSKEEKTRQNKRGYDFKQSLEKKADSNIKLSSNKLYNYNYVPTWRKESILEQLNKSLNVKPPAQKIQEIPKQLFVAEENEDYQQQKIYFFGLIRKVPLERRTRTQQNMNDFIRELPKINFFFKSYSYLYLCSLFKIGKIRFFQQTDIIYEKKFDSSEFFIILWGKVKLSDKKEAFKKISRKGQTLSQEIMFTNLKFKQQKATALEQCYLLQIDHKIYQRFYETMINNGMKSEVLLMQKNIKRNFIAKNTMRATKLQ